MPGRRRPDGGRCRLRREGSIATAVPSASSSAWTSVAGACSIEVFGLVPWDMKVGAPDLPWPPTELADGFGLEGRPTRPGHVCAQGGIHPSAAVGPRLAAHSDSAASGTGSPGWGPDVRPNASNVRAVTWP